MYTKYFKLKEEPFTTTPDPRFLYESEVHQEALERLMMGITHRRGINAIVAEPGLGKSTIIRTLLNGLSKKVHFAWVFNTTMDSKNLIKYICQDFGFMPQSNDMSEILMELYQFLVKDYQKGFIPLLIVDEAQNLTPSVLEEIRQLSNLETMQSKLLQIILSGQPKLDATLDRPELEQLKQRICMKAVLSRLDYDDTVNYIQHRLQVAGGKRDDLFSEAALKLIKKISDGVPRLINQICDNALMVAARRKMKQVDSILITELFEKGMIMAAGAPPVGSRANYTALKQRKQMQEQLAAKPLPSILESLSGDFGGLDLNRLTIN